MHRRTLLLQLVVLIILASLRPTVGQGVSPEVTSNLDDQLIVDVDGDQQIDPGDTVRYSLDVVVGLSPSM